MAPKCTYVDEYFGIEYSSEYQIHIQKGFCYEFMSGNRLLAIHLHTREDWERLKVSCFSVVPQPQSDNKNAPKRTVSEGLYSFGIFAGVSRSWKTTSPKGKLLMQDTHIFLDDGNHTISVRMNDRTEFDNQPIDSLLKGICFPCQALYEELVAKTEHSSECTSPFAVELRHFSQLGSDGGSGSKAYNFSFSGNELSDAQRAALTQFCDHEEDLFIAILERVHQYYTKQEFPVLNRMLPASMLPKIDTPKDVSSYISLSTIHIHESRSKQCVPIGLTFSASWTENDVGVRVVDNEIEAVGTAYVALES